RARIFFGLALGCDVDELHVRVGDRGLLEILVDRRAALLIAAFDLQRYLRAAVALPVDLLVLEDARLVLLRIDLHLEIMRRAPRARAGDDLHRLAGRELGIHPGGRDADALLAAAHAQAVELRAVQ